MDCRVVDTEYTFNSEPLQYLIKGEPPITPLEREPNFKYGDLNYVQTVGGPYTKHLISLIYPFLSFQHKYVTVDVKVQTLEKGQFTCALRAWHIDCVRWPGDTDTKDDIHYLFISGATRTRFLKNPVKLSGPEDYKGIPLGAPATVAPERRFLRFTRNHLHSGDFWRANEVRYFL
jgi:hypothetical protein